MCRMFLHEQYRGHKSSGLAKLFRILVRVPVLKSNAWVHSHLELSAVLGTSRFD